MILSGDKFDKLLAARNVNWIVRSGEVLLYSMARLLCIEIGSLASLLNMHLTPARPKTRGSVDCCLYLMSCI